MAAVEIQDRSHKSLKRLSPYNYISLILTVCIYAVQVMGAKGFKLEIKTDLLQAICVQTQVFASSKTVQSALMNKNSYKHVLNDGGKACGGVICNKKGGKCQSVNDKFCDHSETKPGVNKKERIRKLTPSSGSGSGSETDKADVGTFSAYKGYKVYRATPKDALQLQSLLEMENDGVDFWTEPSNTRMYCDLMLSPQQQAHYLPVTRKDGIDMKETLADVNALIQKEKVAKAASAGDLSWDAFYDLDDIYAFIESLAKKFPDIAKVITYGESYEKRKLKLISISTSSAATASSASLKRPIVFINCNIHAREWITNALCTFLINDMLVEKKECITSFLDKFDFYLIPVANPDGYVYSHQPSGPSDDFRLWKKTTSPTPGSHCIGKDPNRNFDVHWNESGTHSNPCTQAYGGTMANSEVEVEQLQNYLLTPEISSRLRIFLDVHSKAQTLLWPWSYELKNVSQEHYDFFWKTSQKAVEAIKVRHNTEYTQGPAAQVFGPHSGTAFDWVYDKILQNKPETVFAAMFELRDSLGGFIVDGKDILSHILEAMDGMCVVIEAVGSRSGERLTTLKPHTVIPSKATASSTKKPVNPPTASVTMKPVNPTTASVTMQPVNHTTASITMKPVNPPTATVTKKPVNHTTASVTMKPLILTTASNTMKPVNLTTASVTKKPVNPSTASVTMKPVNPLSTSDTMRPVNPPTASSTKKPVNPPTVSTTKKPVIPPNSTEEPDCQK